MHSYSNPGVVSYKEYARHLNLIQALVINWLRGNVVAYDDDELHRIVEERYFSFPSLVDLSTVEEDVLRTHAIHYMRYLVNKNDLKTFVTHPVFWEGGELLCGGRYANNERYQITGSQPISRSEKLRFLRDPANSRTPFTIGNRSGSLARMGYREIKYYFGSNEAFCEAVQIQQERIGRKDLKVLDLGGGIGLGLREAKRLIPELITYNLTYDEETWHYPVDHMVVCFAERMPKVLEGTIDYIFSNMATRYFIFHDRAIEGCIKALSVGGVMDVFFSSDRSRNSNRDDVKRRMKNAYEHLHRMAAEGEIELEIDPALSFGFGQTFVADKGSLYPGSSVKARRLR